MNISDQRDQADRCFTFLGKAQGGVELDCNPTKPKFDLRPDEALVNIPRIVPLDVALPCYGYIIPAVVLVTVVTNTLITIVLSDKSLNTKTNQILLGMAVTEMLTGLSSLPWFLYYYTLRGYEEDMARGMPPVWCTMHRFLSEILPRGFHTASIWLTVLLSMRRYCTVSTVLLRSSRKGIPVKIPIVLACVAAALLELPMAFSRRASSFQKANRTYCVQRLASWVSAIGPSKFFIGSVWFNVVFVHAGPCILLVIYTGLLIRFIRGRAKRRRFATSLRQPNRYHSNAQMLAIILCIFLAAEIPAVVIYVMHVLHLTFKIVPPHGYHAMNIAIFAQRVHCCLLPVQPGRLPADERTVSQGCPPTVGAHARQGAPFGPGALQVEILDVGLPQKLPDYHRPTGRRKRLGAPACSSLLLPDRFRRRSPKVSAAPPKAVVVLPPPALHGSLTFTLRDCGAGILRH